QPPWTTQHPSPAKKPAQQRQGQTAAPTQNQTGAATTSSTIQSASGRVSLSAQQQTTIRQSVFSARNVPRVNNVNFAVNVGVVVPSRVHFAPVSRFSAFIDVFPQFRDDEFFVADDDLFLLRHIRLVVHLVPFGPRSRLAH